MPASEFPPVAVAVVYADREAAIAFLETAFGLERRLILVDAENRIAHAELRWGEGVVMVSGEWSERLRSPAGQGGINTQFVHLHLDPQAHGDVDAHCARARAAGARIVQEPETQFYGDRTYRALDPEGHLWTFAQTIQETPPETWEAAAGVRVQDGG